VQINIVEIFQLTHSVLGYFMHKKTTITYVTVVSYPIFLFLLIHVYLNFCQLNAVDEFNYHTNLEAPDCYNYDYNQVMY
jgi:hypothetical protein